MKKLILAVLALVLCFGLVACGGNNAEQKEIEQIATTLLLSTDQFTSDTVLPDKAASLYEVKWEIESNDQCEVAVNEEGKQYLKILENYEWNKTPIKLTATVYGATEGVQAQKVFEIYARKIKAEALGIQAVMESTETNVIVELTGTVYYVCPQGFWLTDETGYTIYIYGADAVKSVAQGDKVKVTGNKILYYSMYEIEKPAVEVLEKASGTYDLSSMIKENTIDTISTYEKEFRYEYGRLYTVQGKVIEDPTGKYTYGIRDILTGKYVIFYDSAMNDANATKANLQENLGKYVKVDVMVWDHYSSGFVRVLPISEISEAVIPDYSDEQFVTIMKNEIDATDKVLAKDVTLPTNFGKATIEWASENAEVLTAEGKIVSRGEKDIKVKLTAVIKAGSLEETVETEFTVKAVELKSCLEATQIALSGKEEFIKIEGKIVALDTAKQPYFYVADESGVTFVRTKLEEGYQVGDVVSMIVKTTVYYHANTNEITPQLNVVTIEKIEKEVNVKEAEVVEASVIVEKLHADPSGKLGEKEIDDISKNALYGKLVKVRVYVSVRTSGSYTNVYLAVENSADAPAGYYQHTSFLQDELKALDGKLVELVCPVYGYSGLYGWRLGTAISYQEVTE